MSLSIEQIKNGAELEFDNSQWCMDNESDDIRGGSVFWNTETKRFNLVFNGACLMATENPSAIKKRLFELMDKWNLELID